jgi:PTH1 family peptidyl-tRNA hydrolase
VRLVVGLGNPGARYAGTRHNVAWEVLETLARRWNAAGGEATPEYTTRRAERPGGTVVLLRPLTFMNRAGEALIAWQRAAGDDAGDLLVVTDDVYLPVGTVRLRAQGSSGGHRGLESIEQVLGHRQYGRLRLGVGAAESGAELKEHVLDRFTAAERERMDEAVGIAADAVDWWVAEGILAAMNRFNRRAGKEVSEP